MEHIAFLSLENHIMTITKKHTKQSKHFVSPRHSSEPNLLFFID